MFKRQTTGSVVCVSCGYLVGVNDESCYNCGRRNPGLWGYAPALRSLGQDLGFVPFVTGVCIIVYALSLLASGGLRLGGGLTSFMTPSTYAAATFGASGAVPVFGYNRWWTILSAGWLHFGLLHLVMNLWGVRFLAPELSELYGAGRMILIYMIGSIAGFLISSLAGYSLLYIPIHIPFGASVTAGASAALFGLIGGAVRYGHRTGSRHVTSQAWSWAIPTIIIGLIMPGIDNAAHIGGFIGGYVAGFFLDPLKPERIKHMLWALILVVASLLAVVVSVIVRIPVLY